MPFFVSRSERSVGELVTHAFGDDLTAAERRRAETAIERANPHLRDRGEVARDSVVRIPDVPGVGRARLDRADGPPAAETVSELARILEEHREELAQAFEREAARLQQVLELVDDDELRRAVEAGGGGTDRLDTVRDATEKRRKALERSGEALERAAEAVEELGEVAERLG